MHWVKFVLLRWWPVLWKKQSRERNREIRVRVSRRNVAVTHPLVRTSHQAMPDARRRRRKHGFQRKICIVGPWKASCGKQIDNYSQLLGHFGGSVLKNPPANSGDMDLIPWWRAWQPTPVFLPGKSHGLRSLAGYSPWGCKESDTT